LQLNLHHSLKYRACSTTCTVSRGKVFCLAAQPSGGSSSTISPTRRSKVYGSYGARIGTWALLKVCSLQCRRTQWDIWAWIQEGSGCTIVRSGSPGRFPYVIIGCNRDPSDRLLVTRIASAESIQMSNVQQQFAQILIVSRKEDRVSDRRGNGIENIEGMSRASHYSRNLSSSSCSPSPC
jgi:hypothetical protein